MCHLAEGGIEVSGPHEDATVHFFGATDIGKSRRSNQDHFLIADMQRVLKVCDSSVRSLAQQSLVSSPPGELLIIADGMGGHAHGEYASQAAVSFMTRYVATLMPRFLNTDPDDDRELRTALKEGPILVHRLFQKEGENDPSKSEMGTTLTTAYIVWPYLYVVHVGDTRCYLFRNGELRQLTKDHTIAQYLADAGELPTAPSQSAHLQSMLWNSVTGRVRPEPQICRESLESADTVLLCSDGLTKHMSTSEIATILASSESVEFKTKRLIEECNRRGGRDNISVVVGVFFGPPDAELLCNDPGQFNAIESLSDTDIEFTVSP